VNAGGEVRRGLHGHQTGALAGGLAELDLCVVRPAEVHYSEEHEQQKRHHHGHFDGGGTVVATPSSPDKPGTRHRLTHFPDLTLKDPSHRVGAHPLNGQTGMGRSLSLSAAAGLVARGSAPTVATGRMTPTRTRSPSGAATSAVLGTLRHAPRAVHETMASGPHARGPVQT